MGGSNRAKGSVPNLKSNPSGQLQTAISDVAKQQGLAPLEYSAKAWGGINGQPMTPGYDQIASMLGAKKAASMGLGMMPSSMQQFRQMLGAGQANLMGLGAGAIAAPTLYGTLIEDANAKTQSQ